MADETLLRSIDLVESTGKTTIASVEAVIEALGPAREQHAAGVPAGRIADRIIATGVPDLRRRSSAALADYERAVMHFRSAIIRTLVEREGLSLSAVSRRMGISRQMATRLYRAEQEP